MLKVAKLLYVYKLCFHHFKNIFVLWWSLADIQFLNYMWEVLGHAQAIAHYNHCGFNPEQKVQNVQKFQKIKFTKILQNSKIS
jgi:hypothetical protein